MHPRTIDAIALMPKDNYQGSHYFFNLDNKTIFSRDWWKVIPISNTIIEKINKISISEKNLISNENLQFSLNNVGGIIHDNIVDNADAPVKWRYINLQKKHKKVPSILFFVRK